MEGQARCPALTPAIAAPLYSVTSVARKSGSIFRHAMGKSSQKPPRWFDKRPTGPYTAPPCPGGGIGRRAGFRCQWLNGREGSSPFLGTICPCPTSLKCGPVERLTRTQGRVTAFHCRTARILPRSVHHIFILPLNA